MSTAVPTLEELERLTLERIGGTRQPAAVADKNARDMAFTSLRIELNEDSLALGFTRQHRDHLRYTEEWHKWHEWDGTRWIEDTTLKVFGEVRIFCRSAAQGATSEKEITQVKSAKTVAAVERMARYDRIHAVRPDVWDADSWLLGTPAGVIDLRTGLSRTAQPEDYITKQTRVAPDSSMQCPQWLALLDWATGADAELVAFLQRMFGYMLTGQIHEHALFFVYGTGGNGKGTVVNAAAEILGDYATVSPMETFTESKWDRHPTELAGLRGARLVTAQETERGRKWAESRIKALTGGDPIRARFMRQDFFTFRPEFKLLIAANEKPALLSVDEAIRRRFHLIPFEQRIAPESKDVELPEKLRAEYPAILAWMISGCQMWLEMGLRPPARVQAATDAYLEEQDTLGAWLSEACKRGPHEWASTRDLYDSWSTWARRAGEDIGSTKAFSSELAKQAGISPKRGRDANGTRGFQGVSIKPDTATAYASNGYQREVWP